MSTLQPMNNSEYWRAFEENNVTHSVAHYLMAVSKLLDELGYARVTDVASFLKITRGAASLALTQLKDRGLIKEDQNRFLLLSEKGEKIARVVHNNYVILNRFFDDILCVGEESAQIDACKMEHLLSEKTSQNLLRFLHVLYQKPSLLENLTEEVKQSHICEKNAKDCPLCERLDSCLLAPYLDSDIKEEDLAPLDLSGDGEKNK